MSPPVTRNPDNKAGQIEGGYLKLDAVFGCIDYANPEPSGAQRPQCRLAPSI